MNAGERARLIEAVQTNCDIADATHAGDLTLCIYLLQMREFFRWEQGLGATQALNRAQVGQWIADREALWTTLEGQAYRPVPLPALDSAPAREADAFDLVSVQQHLRPHGLIYGAGLVAPGRHLFFLADLRDESEREGLPVRTAGHELARSLTCPPAALVNDGASASIVIRRESLQRWCCERFETFALRRTPGTAMHATVQAYGLDEDFDAALAPWLDDMSETLVLHEIGEHRAGMTLGPAWAAMRLSLPSRVADLQARAVRDHLADLGVTLPTLLERGDPAPLHAWFATYEGMQEALFPGLKTAYLAWRDGDGGRALHLTCQHGHAHFAQLAQEALALHAREGDRGGARVADLLSAPGAVCSA